MSEADRLIETGIHAMEEAALEFKHARSNLHVIERIGSTEEMRVAQEKFMVFAIGTLREVQAALRAR